MTRVPHGSSTGRGSVWYEYCMSTGAVSFRDERYTLYSSPLEASPRLLVELATRVHIDHVTNETHLLDSLAEGPAHTVICMVTDESDDVLGTIRSLASSASRPRILAVGPASDVRCAISAMQAGADVYFTEDETDRLLAEIGLSDRVGAPVMPPPDSSHGGDDPFAGFITQDEQIRALFAVGTHVARTAAPILISGETGTGKEVFARSLHRASGRSGELVTENVAGIDDQLFSDSLFGHRRGAFTGAVGNRAGLIERASDGTLFLDEIGDLSPASQVKLLRLIEDGTYYPLGADVASRSHARLVLATNRSFVERVQSGRFRPDLYFRLATFHFEIPPLRARPNDIPLLVDHFRRVAADELAIGAPDFPPATVRLLCDHNYPGNVRELRGLVTTLVSYARDPRIGAAELDRITASLLRRNLDAHDRCASPVAFPDELPTIDEVTDQLIGEALKRSDGNQSAAARLLGISPSAVNKRLRRRGSL